MRYSDVCTFKQAEFFSELGIVEFPHAYAYVGETEEEVKGNVQFTDGYDWDEYPGYRNYWLIIPAYTSAELGVMLPSFYYTWKEGRRYYSSDKTAEGHQDKYAGKTEAESKAALLIYLLKNKMTNVDEINKRIKSVKR